MADRVERASSLSRREFMTKASVALAAAATLAVLTRNLSSSQKGPANAFAGDSMFTPRPGSRLRHWAHRLARIRLR